MFRSKLLDGALTLEQRQQGFSLVEEEDFINLLLKDRVKAVFNSKGVTFTEIRETADRIAQKNN